VFMSKAVTPSLSVAYALSLSNKQCGGLTNGGTKPLIGSFNSTDQSMPPESSRRTSLSSRMTMSAFGFRGGSSETASNSPSSTSSEVIIGPDAVSPSGFPQADVSNINRTIKDVRMRDTPQRSN